MNDRRVPPGGAVLICVLLGAVLWVALASCALGRTVTHDTGGSVSARQAEIAAAFGVSQTLISAIKRRRLWND